MQAIKYYIGVYGEAVGLFIVGFVSAYDLLMQGVRGFLEWRIAPLGIVAIWLGVILIVASKHLDKNF